MSRKEAKATRPQWRRLLYRPAVWFGGVLTVVVTGILTSLLQQFLTPAMPSSDVVPSTPSRSGPPTKVVALQVRKTDEHHGWIFQQKLDLTSAELQSLNAAEGTINADGVFQSGSDRWLRDRGAVDPDFSVIKLVLEGNRDKPVRIIDIRPIAHCATPLKGTLFYFPPGGSDDTIKIGFDLDKPQPFAQKVENHLWGNDYFTDKTISLKPDEQQVFQIIAKTRKYYCRYTFELVIIDDEKTVTQTIDHDGRPFQVTALIAQSDNTVFSPGRFSHYQSLYIGGLARVTEPGASGFIRKDPATYPEGR